MIQRRTSEFAPLSATFLSSTTSPKWPRFVSSLNWRCAALGKRAKPCPSDILMLRRCRLFAKSCRKLRRKAFAWYPPRNSHTKQLGFLGSVQALFSSSDKENESRAQESP